MKKITYAIRWDDIREKSWSGTGYALFEALRRQSIVEDGGVTLSKKQKIIEFVFEKLKNKLYLKKNYYLAYKAKQKSKRYAKNSDAILVVGLPILMEDTKTYYYNDLTNSCMFQFQKEDKIGFSYEDVILRSDKKFKSLIADEIRRHKNCSGIFTMSKWLCEYIKQEKPEIAEKVHHAGGGINIDKSKIDATHKKGNKILFVGRAFNRKNGPLVVEAFKMLREKYRPDAELYIIGPEVNPVGEHVDGLYFEGEIPSGQLHEYFNKCDIFCMPSRFEAYGLVFIEALCFGLPCIGRDSYAMPEFIEDGKTGYLVTGDNASELCDRMNDLLINESIKYNVIAKRDEYLQEYSWDTVAKRILDVIEADCN